MKMDLGSRALGVLVGASQAWMIWRPQTAASAPGQQSPPCRSGHQKPDSFGEEIRRMFLAETGFAPTAKN